MVHIHHKRHKKHKEVRPSLDKYMLLVGFVGPLTTVPQAMQIWEDKNVSGLSLFSWMMYLVLSFVWLYYGYAHRDKPIMISNVLYVVVNIIVIGGILMFR